MITTGDESIFIQQVEAVQQRAQQLYQCAGEASDGQPQILVESLEQLRIALEELYVAEEELRHQNEQLMAARQAAEAERQRYQELFEFAPDGYLVSDIHGTIREANRAAALLLNIAQKHLVGKPLASFVPDDYRRGFRSMLNQLHVVNRVQEWEMRLCGREDTPFDAALTVETVRDKEGNAIALRWLLRDITARKRAEEQMHQIQLQNLELIEADRLKTQFIATISHELRTPMNSILGFSELLLRRFHHQYEPQLVTMIERIFNNGKHLLKIIEEILDFSKLKGDHLQLKLEVFDLAKLVTSIVEELHPLAEQKNLKLQVHLAASSIPVVNDSQRLRQVLINLLSNAIKFTDTGSVRLEVWELPQERVAIAIIDTGIGIDSADQTLIFQEFRQVNQSSTRRHGGTGLGLSIANALVQLMQGTISMESQIGKGSTFRVELPRRVSLPTTGILT